MKIKAEIGHIRDISVCGCSKCKKLRIDLYEYYNKWYIKNNYMPYRNVRYRVIIEAFKNQDYKLLHRFFKFAERSDLIFVEDED